MGIIYFVKAPTIMMLEFPLNGMRQPILYILCMFPTYAVIGTIRSFPTDACWSERISESKQDFKEAKPKMAEADF